MNRVLAPTTLRSTARQLQAQTGRSVIQRRTAATAAEAAPGTEFISERQSIKHHAAKSSDMWRKVSFYVCIPGAIVAYAWVRKLEGEHHEHLEHVKNENDGELPEKVMYPYMNKREKPFPWGMQSLFFNPKVNVPVEE